MTEKTHEVEFYEKLKMLKDQVGRISKDSTNPFYNSKYFDINKLLEHLEPLLHEHGLMVLQPITDEKVISRIICLKTGQHIDSSMELVNRQDPQKRGSEVTYYRRYTLVSLLGLQAEDDDANRASGKQSEKQPKDNKPWLNIQDKSGAITPQWQNILLAIEAGKIKEVKDVRAHYKLSIEVATKIKEAINS